MKARAQLDPAAINVANDIMHRLSPLSLTLTNARAFRSLLEDLYTRDLSKILEPHVSSIQMVRAAILRAAIGTIMASVDRKGTDRASIGQIIHMFEKMDLSILAIRWPNSTFGATALQQAKTEWTELLDSSDFQDCKDFRDGTVGHTLVLDIPIIANETYFRVHERAELIALRFYDICGFGKPEFLQHQITLTTNAAIFWDTYWKGMTNSNDLELK